MKRTTIFIDESVEADLHALARRQQRPVAAVVREAVEQYVVGQRRARDARPSFAAIGRSGVTDTAAHHEAILFADLPPCREAAAAKTTRAPARYPPPRRRTSKSR